MLLGVTAFPLYSSESVDYAEQGKYKVLTEDSILYDLSRDNRDIPFKVYYPENPQGKCPLVIFSHGLGGNKNLHSFLGELWASNGIISVHVQHRGSDTAILKTLRPMHALKEAMSNPEISSARPKDVSFMISSIKSVCNGKFKEMVDMDRIGVAGHSYGAYTAMACAGQKLRPEYNFKDPRVKAIIEMSFGPPKTRDGVSIYKDVTIPALHMTGTEDELFGRGPDEKRIPFDSISAPGQYLIILNGGDHMVFGGKGKAASEDNMNIIKSSCMAFWKKYLFSDPNAALYLDSDKDGLVTLIRKTGSTYERKKP